MRAFAASFSIEATRPSESEIGALAEVLAPGTAVYLSAVPAMALDELVTLAASLRRAGLDPARISPRGGLQAPASCMICCGRCVTRPTCGSCW